MKRIFLIAIAIIVFTSYSHAQITTDPSTGNVGIGTTTPAAQLHVFGPGQTTGNLSPAANVGGTLFLQDSNGAPGNGGAVLFGSIFGPFAGIKGLVQDGRTYTIGDLAFSTRASMANSNLTERMRISYNGNVGIGTPSPTQALDVNGNINSSHDITLGNIGSTTAFNNAYYVYNSGNCYGLDLGFNSVSDRFNTRLFTPVNGDIVFSSIASLTTPTVQSQFAQLLTIRGDNGNVGIGIVDPQEKLAVNGTIHSKKMIIDLIGWPDYVFKPTYNLKPLSEVKTYIDLNHHLPEMPSEKEVAEKGVDLGEMNKLLTKKVEELTLYLIEQQKQIDQLKKQMKERN